MAWIIPSRPKSSGISSLFRPPTKSLFLRIPSRGEEEVFLGKGESVQYSKVTTGNLNNSEPLNG